MPLLQTYSASLVALSILIAMLASYTALDLAGRVHAAEGRTRAIWLGGGALAMGVGIWSMHFVGMLALRIPIPVVYALPQLVASIAVAVGASYFALYIAARPLVRPVQLLAAALAMGIAIAGMHYIGMSGMRMDATIAYDSLLYWTSVAIAIAASYVALQIARRLRGAESARGKMLRGGAAVVMGLAIAGMHYTGMAAANFIPVAAGVTPETGLPPIFLAILVAVAGVLIVGLALIAAMLDRLVRSKSVEMQLRAEKEAAEATNRAKSEFLSNMSHELRTPLNSIIGFSNIMLKNKAGNLRPVDMTHLSRITANGTHLLGVINGVLDLSKIEAGRMELEMTTVDLPDLVRETLDEMAAPSDTEVALIADVPSNVGLLYADRSRLKQIIINLVGNALKFTKQGSVTIRVVPDVRNARPARIDVMDTGIGIPADRLQSVFDAFRQADNTTARQYGGTGLGLTITRSLAELMGWRIEVRSEVGVGTTFSIVLGPDLIPAAAPIVSPFDASAGVGDPSRRSRFRVLVVDDEADSRTLIQNEFEDLGCEVFLAASADEGIALSRRVNPDLITMDVMMPGKSGLDALQEIKRDHELAHIPVVIVSVVAQESRNKAVGAVEVIEKPLTRAAIAHLIRKRDDETQAQLLLVRDSSVRLVMVS